MRALLLVAALAAGDDRHHHRNHSRGNWTRAELSVAFTTDLHGEIGALKHAFWLARSLPAPALVVDSGDACVGTAYFRRAGPAGMGRAMRGLGYAALGVGNQLLRPRPRHAPHRAGNDGPVQRNFTPLELGRIEVVSADVWMDRSLSASSFQTVEQRCRNRANTFILASC